MSRTVASPKGAAAPAVPVNGTTQHSSKSKEFSLATYLNLTVEQQETYLKLLILTVSCIMCKFGRFIGCPSDDEMIFLQLLAHGCFPFFDTSLSSMVNKTE